MSTEPTLGQIRNRIAVLFADKTFRPDLPLSSILTPDELRALSQLVQGETRESR